MRTGTVSYKLEDLKKGVIIPIGFVGENDFTRVIFDAEEIYKKYPSASVSMKVQPPKGVIYPAAVTRDGNTVIWQVKEADVANRGGGELQLTFIDGETKIKTYISKTDVKRSLAGNGPAPDPVQDWVDNAEEVLDDLAAIDNIAKTAQASDIGKALSPKTVENGVVTEWEYITPGGGTEDYTDLDNKPSIAGVTLSGNKTLEDLGIAAADDLDNLANDVTDVKTAIQGKPDIKDSNKTDVAFDLSDDDGYVIFRIKDGHIITTGFNSESAIVTSNLVEKLGNVNIYNRLKGVKWDALGDSLTDPSTVGNSHKNYTKWIAEKNGMNLNNCGVGGKGYWQGIEDEVQNVRSDTDIVTIFGSLNDIGNYTTNPGNPTDTWAGGYSTYCARARRVFDALLAVKTGIRIGVILPTPWVNYNPYDTASATQTDVENMLKSLSDICKIYGIPVLDLYHNSNLRPWDSTFRTAYYVQADGYHPNEAGNKLFIAPQVEQFLLSLASTY